MEAVTARFPNGLPTLAELKEINKGKDVPLETAWIWGPDDEVGGSILIYKHKLI